MKKRYNITFVLSSRGERGTKMLCCRVYVLGMAGLLAGAGPAGAQTSAAEQTAPAAPAERQGPAPGQTGAPSKAPSPEAPTGLWERANLLGDMGGLRSLLGNHGVSLGLAETSEVLGNPTGGRRSGAVYEGLTEASLGVDLGKAVGLSGGIVNISAFQIHGRGLSSNNINNLNIVSSLEADRSTRLFEWWYQQSFLGGRADVKIGQQGADQEFMVSQYGGLFFNAGFGWATLPSVDLPSGGPAYPLAALGVRLRAQPLEPLTVLLGVYNGSPAGLGVGDPQRRDASGTNFDLNSGVFVIGEVQYAINPGGDAPGLAGTYKLGAWYNSNAFTDQFFTVGPITAAAAFANPPRARRNDWSVYGVVDQLVYRPPGAKDGGAGVFIRAMGAPGDRNQVNMSVNGGVTYKGAFGRDNDTAGLGLGWARIGDRARAGDAALAAFSGGFYPVRSSETVLELSYQAALAPWWTVQPDFQYVFSPGGGILNPNRPGKRLGDAAILGVRTGVIF